MTINQGNEKRVLTIEASIALPLMIFIIISLLIYYLRVCSFRYSDCNISNNFTVLQANTLNKSLGDAIIVSGYFKNSKV